ncbi:MAG: hypothetical protein HC800_01905 [Phormidesmis sp. RL_2_1]|nr:hypothetical protein [Phormidesmis sp. RL_2_1]
MPQRLLFISNGHGEDDNSSHVIRSLKAIRPELEIAALPLVGEGHAYRKLSLPIVGPTYVLPSGGFTYMDRLRLIDDLRAGLLNMTWKQFQAMKKYAPQVDFVVATGDTFAQSFAYFSGKPFLSNIASLSAMYEGRLKMDLLLWQIFKSQRCQAVVTRDAFTAQDLQQQGLKKVRFGGFPSVDRIKPTGKDLQLSAGQNMVALLPGSRTAEAIRNFKLAMQLAQATTQLNPQLQFRAALVPSVMAAVKTICQQQGWQCEQQHHPTQQPWMRLHHAGDESFALPTEILCYSDAYSDIIRSATLVFGMAGMAVDQAVAIGKPVVQVAGTGPQFTYAFAEAQERLLGLSVRTIGQQAATPAVLKAAAQYIVTTLEDPAYLQACVENGRQKFGPFGGSARIANTILQHLDHVTASPTVPSDTASRTTPPASSASAPSP